MEFTFIAEVGVNHGGDIYAAKQMIADIADAGANIVKFQTYKADKLAAVDSPGYWDFKSEPTRSQIELFRKYDAFGQPEYEELHTECEAHGVEFLSTPFDTECLPWLMPLMKRVKIASADLTNYLLLDAVSGYHLPIIMSVGASTHNEIAGAIEFIRSRTDAPITLLHCMLLYPTIPMFSYLSQISKLKAFEEKYDDISIGYSDHVPVSAMQNDQLLIAYALGATVIEKHYTSNKDLKGNDHYHAVDKIDLKNVIERLKIASSAIREADLDEIIELQETARNNARRSLHFQSSMKVGQMITKTDLVAKRPGIGISPKQFETFAGSVLEVDVEKDQRLQENMFVKK
ncbi:N-acetylneuraminate synthase family protein [Amylibacter sp.]|nr:N-acetylneuraminate synthase family protein [Amylibacter sp.]